MLTPLAGANQIQSGLPAGPVIKQQAKDLEGVFLNTLMKEVFSSIKTDEKSFGGGFAEETWRGMQAEQYASAIADNGGVGLADQLVGELMKLQEAAQTQAVNPAANYSLTGGNQ